MPRLCVYVKLLWCISKVDAICKFDLILTNDGLANLFCQPVCVKIGASTSSRSFLVAFRDRRTDGRTYTIYNSIRLLNSVEAV